MIRRKDYFMIYEVLKKVALLILLGLIFGCSSNDEVQKKEQVAPDSTQQLSMARLVEQASFTSLDGDTVKISDFKGKVVAIDLWETWCQYCLEGFPTMQKLQDEYTDDFIVLAITPGFSDTPRDAREFAKEHNYDFKYLIDTNGLSKKIGVQGIPFKLFLDSEGNFITKSIGTQGSEVDYKNISNIIEEHRQEASEKGGTERKVS